MFKKVHFPVKSILPALFPVLLSVFITISAKAQYNVQSQFGNLSACDTLTSGIFIVWWDKDYDHLSDAIVLLDSMNNYRDYCLEALSMQDPPNPVAGFYYNIYIHHAGDIFPDGWALGQGTDTYGYPFLTIPAGTLGNWVSIAHETFHVFQYSGNSPGFAYTADSQWYIEASANWFAAIQNPGENSDFLEAESLVRLPQVCLWLSYDNFPAYYPQNWQRYVHQYALSVLLVYLTEVADLPPTMITVGFYNGTSELPQEFFFNQLGGANFRSYFLNWAAQMTNHFDFLMPGQIATFENEWNNYADPADDNEFILVLDDNGTNGWIQPADSLITTAWSFNTYKLLNQSEAAYLFELNGDEQGSAGDPAFFEGKILIQNENTGSSFYDLEMSNDLEGSLSLDLTSSDTTAYFIIASMPEVFQDVEQTFGYSMRITKTNSTGLSNTHVAPDHRKIIGRYNLKGQKVEAGYHGIQIRVYKNRTADKIFNPGN